MLTLLKQNFDERKYLSMSLNDMVIEIINKPNVFKGNSHVMINRIREIKNKGDSGWSEIKNAWDIESKGEAKRKIDKYFNEGLKVDSDLSIKKSVKINLNDKGSMPQPIGVKDKEISSAENKYESRNLNGGIGKKIQHAVEKIASNFESGIELKKSKRDEESEKINKVECNSFDDLINNLKKGEALSERELSYIKFLMSYIRTKAPIGNEDNIRKELENVFVKITNLIRNDDKSKVLHLYQEQRFLSIYNSSCRVATYAIESLLEKKGFQKETITKIKEYLINYSNEYLVKLKLNESKYNDYIKNIKKFSDFDIFKGVESIDKIIFLKGILSENKFTSEGRRFLTEFSDNLKDERIIDFIKDKINLDVGLLKSEYDSKCFEEKNAYDKYVKEKNAYDKYVKEKNKIIDAAINRIKSMLIVSKMPKSIVDSVIEVINKERSNIKIEPFSSKIDLIINMLQCKRTKVNEITNDIEHYLNISMEQLKLEVEIAKSKKISFQERLSSLLNNLNNRVLNFIYYVKHSFK
ncbi:hypothetical protein [Providencia sp. Me31A]|uniref:hypothetical protein n=1 Tax=Providencia sp. Me31A TaxID=3392637 RepID=UPI003D2CE9E7